MVKSACAVIGLITAFTTGRAALAQSQPPNEDVAARAHPEYDPIGLPLVSFRLYPSVTTSVNATDNYRATSTDRQADGYLSVRPEAALRSTWARHRLEARAFVQRDLHLALGNEDVTTFGARASGDYDVSRQTRVSVDFAGERAAESRSDLGSFRGSPVPVRYNVARGSLSVAHRFLDLSITGRGGFEHLDFRDAAVPGGGRIDQDFRDFRTVFAEANASYDLSNGIGVIATARYDDLRYDFRPGSAGFVSGIDLDRGSSGVSLQAGLRLELSKLVFGSIRAGYLSRRYPDPRLRDVNGADFSADVLWNPTPLTSVRVRAGRRIQDSGSIGFAGYTRSEFSVGLNHELYRHVLLSADAAYNHFSANGPGPTGNEYSLGLAARYLVNRRFTLSGSLRHSGRNSANRSFRFNATQATVRVGFAL